jgi:hypothetical protein
MLFQGRGPAPDRIFYFFLKIRPHISKSGMIICYTASELRLGLYERGMIMLGTARPIQDRVLAELEKKLARAEFQNLRPTLARISRESPNVLPLLNFIPPARWSRRDLLQDKVLRAASPFFKNFSPAALRWLRRAPAETLDSFHFYFDHFKNDSSANAHLWIFREVAELMAGLPARATEQPELAKEIIVYSYNVLAWFPEMYQNGLTAGVKRLLRLLAGHLMALWAARECLPGGLASEDVLYDEDGFFDILDWFEVEGQAQGLPDKNSTWRSLKRRSDKWHENVWRRKLTEKNTAWESLLGETVIDGLKITPLVTGLDLYNEGHEMRHCVQTYASRCVNEGWRVFSLKEAEGTRSTLSLRPQNNNYIIDQHKGPENAPVSPAAARAAREVCRLYNQKCRQAAETAVTSAAA